MKFREHPLLAYGSFRPWPPMWAGMDNPSERPLGGEAGILTDVRIHDRRIGKISLRMRDNDAKEYLAYLLIDNYGFLLKTYELLKNHLGQPVKDIGNSEIE